MLAAFLSLLARLLENFLQHHEPSIQDCCTSLTILQKTRLLSSFFVSLFVVIVAVMQLLYTHLSTMARTLHTLSGNNLENLLAVQNGEQMVAMERRKTSFGNGTSTAAVH